MVIKKVELEKVIGIKSKIPENIYPEVAFAGRSNVGKSSLINSLMNRKALARVSATPGKTQTINYYNVNNKIYLVDLPGYGYTRVGESVKAKWGAMVERYLKKSSMLKYVFLLVDIRHKPTKDDILMYNWLLEYTSPIVIGTKLDKLKKSQIKAQLRLISDSLSSGVRIIPFSSKTKEGVTELWEIIEDVCQVQDN